MKLKPLYSKDNKGKIRVWEVKADGQSVVVTHGLLGGAQQVDVKVCEGKNIGRANETTPRQQALKEAQAMWLNKKKRKYTEELHGESEMFKPMLAKTYKGNESKASYPCYLQPKLDGVRCIAKFADGYWKLFSRDGQELDVEHIRSAVSELGLPTNTILDGELYRHQIEFSTIVSWVKDINRPDRDGLQYHVYDIASSPEPFYKRLSNPSKELTLHKLENQIFCVDTAQRPVKHLLKVVPTLTCNSFDEVQEYLSQLIEDGYEGGMLRNANGLYKNGRSSDLLKLKEFEDDEFVVIGAYSGDGREAGAVIWKCTTKDGVEFDCRPQGSIEERRKLYDNYENYIGKKLTVQYFGYGSNNRPRFPVGKGFRLEQ